jgi:hypothetical protein
MKRIYIAISTVGILMTFLSLTNAQTRQALETGFPISKGSYWIYGGSVKGRESQTDCDNTEPVEKKLTWKMEVLDTINRGNVTAAILKGHAYDLMDASALSNGVWRLKRGTYLLVLVGPDKVYLLDNKEEMDAVLKRLRDGSDSLYGLVEDVDLLLDLPLHQGKVFGDRSQMERSQNLIQAKQIDSVGWLNVVFGERKADLRQVRGLALSGEATEYKLRYGTNSSDRQMGFVPGVGITAFDLSYHPAGCLILETHVQLIEYHRGI